MTESELIYDKLCEITGPYREYSPVAAHRIYGSYHFEKFTKVDAWRNTLIRFEEFLIPASLAGKKVLDFGSCLGSLTFESIRRGACQGIGFEFNRDRIDVSNRLAKYLQIDDKLKFIQMDVDAQDPQAFIDIYGQADIVFCCALDKYINKEKLYRFIASVASDICYFETNSQIKQEVFTQLMHENGFELVIGIGSSQSNKDPYRYSYILQKKPVVINEKKGVSCEIDNQMVPVNNIVYRIHDHVYIKYSDLIYNSIKKLYEKVKEIKYVPKMRFHQPFIVTPFYQKNLFKYQATNEEKVMIKAQLIDCVRQLNKTGIAHRDLHIKNAYFDDNLLQIGDWEMACENPCKLHESYDLTGLLKGVSGYKYQMEGKTQTFVFTHHVLLDNCLSFYRYLDGNLKLEDFVGGGGT